MPDDTTASCGAKRKRSDEDLLPSEWFLHPYDAPSLILVLRDYTSVDDIIIIIHGQDGSKFGVRVNKAWRASFVLNGMYIYML